MHQESRVIDHLQFRAHVPGTDPKVPMDSPPLLRNLSEEARMRLIGGASTRRSRRHDVVLNEGDAVTHVYLVRGGSFKLVRRSHGGRELIVRLVGAGGCFGALARAFVSEVSAESLESSVHLRLPLSTLLRLAKENPDFALDLLAYSEDCRLKAEALSVLLAHDSVSRRLARLLRNESDACSGRLLFPLSQSEVASLIGSTRETVCATLNRFRREGILQIQHGEVRVRDRERLLDIV